MIENFKKQGLRKKKKKKLRKAPMVSSLNSKNINLTGLKGTNLNEIIFLKTSG
jgi:hypothetical protein